MSEGHFGKREGETELDFDPASLGGDGQVVFIGRIRSPWTRREDCPKNMRAARERGRAAVLEISEAYRPGLEALRNASHAIVLTWMDRAPRNLILQKPRHAHSARGVFSMRSPARPNPIGLHVVELNGIDQETGEVILDAIDVLDNTPVIDVKPYFASTDSIPEAVNDGSTA